VLVADFIYLKPKTSGIGFLIVLAGLPAYWLWGRLEAVPAKTRKPRPEPTSGKPDDR